MKSAAALFGIGFLFFASEVLAQDRTMNGFTADNLFGQDAAFIENRFGIQLPVITSLPLPSGLNGFAVGIQPSLSIKLHDYVGVSGRFVGMAQVGGDTSDNNLRLDAAYNIKADGSLDVKIFRAEEIGAQWIFHFKTTYQRRHGVFADSRRLSSEINDPYYTSLVGQKIVDVGALTKHIKDDIGKIAKDNLAKLTSASGATYAGGGGSVSWFQVFHPNAALMASAGVVMGNSLVEIPGVKPYGIVKMQVTMGAAGCVSLDPVAPITLRVEYEHEVNEDNVTNLVLGSLVYSKKAAPVSVAVSGGKYFTGDKATPIAVLGIDYYF